VVAPSVDLLALLRPETVTVHFHGRPWSLLPRTAADWIGAVAFDTDKLSGVFPGQIQDEDLEEMFTIGMQDLTSRFWVQLVAGTGGGH